MSVASESATCSAAKRSPRVPPGLEATRPRQWTKNLLLLAGLVFAGKAADARLWFGAAAGVVSFVALSSSAYLLNDVRDAAQDRGHPRKRFRPVARGDLSPAGAYGLAASLAAVAFVVGAFLGSSFVVLLAGFGTLQLAYSFALKRVPIVDVVTIAGAFALRAAAGAAAADVPASHWLLICTVLLALFLAFAKRRGELVLVRKGETSGRAGLGFYTVSSLDVLVWLAAVATVASYVAYTVVGRDRSELLATVPFVLFGIARYLYLVHRADLGEEPERILVRDAPILLSVALWASTALWILTLS